VCNDAHRNHVTKEATDNIAKALESELASLDSCVPGGHPSFTLRFDSTSTLTGFGIDDEHPGGGISGASCVDSVRAKQPAVTYPGPATLRCREQCRARPRSR
jgi:hypothetical protein